MRATGATGARSASFLSYVRAGRATPMKANSTAPLTSEDRRSNPRGSRGSTIVNNTLADVNTTTMRPRAKRTTFTGRTGSRLAVAGHPFSIAPCPPHRTVAVGPGLGGSGRDRGARWQLEQRSGRGAGECGDFKARRIGGHLDVPEDALGSGADRARPRHSGGLEIDAVHCESVYRHRRRADLVSGYAGGEREISEETDPVGGGVEIEELVLVGRIGASDFLACPWAARGRGGRLRA